MAGSFSGKAASAALLLFLILFCFLTPASADYETFHSSFSRDGIAETGPVDFDLWLDSMKDVEEPQLIAASVYYSYEDIGYRRAILSSPVVAGNKVYFGTVPVAGESDFPVGIFSYSLDYPIYEYSSNLILLDGYWHIEAGVAGGLTYSDGKIFFGGGDGKLYCADAAGKGKISPYPTTIEDPGTILWVTDRIDETDVTGLSSAPLVCGDRVWVTSQMPAALYGFNLTTGAQEIRTDLVSGVAGRASPSVNDDGSVIFTAGRNGTAAADAVTGEIIWAFDVSGAGGTPVYSDGCVFFETEEDLYCLNAASGEEQWHTAHAGNATAPVVTASMVIANGDNGLTAYSRENGAQIWNNPTDENSSVSPNSPVADVSNNVVYYTQNYDDRLGFVYKVDLTDGATLNRSAQSLFVEDNEFISSHDIDYLCDELFEDGFGAPIIYSSPALADSSLFVGTGECVPEGFDPDVTDFDYWEAVDCGGMSSLWFFGLPDHYQEVLAEADVVPYYGETFESDVGEIRYDTVYGVLETGSFRKEGNGYTRIYSYSLQADDDGVRLVSVKGYSDKDWYIYKNGNLLGTSIDPEEPVNIGDQLVFAYGGTPDDAAYVIRLTVSDMIFPSLFISPNEKATGGMVRMNVPSSSSGTLYARAADAKGNRINDPEIEWSSEGPVRIVPDGDSCIWTTDNVSGSSEAVIRAVHTESGMLLKSEIVFTVYDEETIRDMIPKNSSVEQTDTFFTARGNYARTGVAAGEGPKTPTILWDCHFPDVQYTTLVDGHPALSSGNVYVTTWGGAMSGDGTSGYGVYSFNASTGEQNWYSETMISRTGLTVVDGRIYGGGGSSLMCVDEKTGQLIWSTGSISNAAYIGLTSVPLIFNDTVYVSAVYVDEQKRKVTESLYGFTLDDNDGDGKPEEIFRLDAGRGTGMFASPALSPAGENYPAVVYAAGDGGVFAVDTTTNQKIWSFDAGASGQGKATFGGTIDYGGNGIFVSGPAYRNGCVYFTVSNSSNYSGEYGTGIYCLDAVTGTLKWHDKVNISSVNTPVVTEDKVLFVCDGLYAYDQDGNRLWFCETEVTEKAAATVAGNMAYFGTYGAGKLYAVDITTGEVAWSYKMPLIAEGTSWYSLIEATPSIESGILYIGSENGHFYAFKDPDMPDTFTITAVPSRYGVIRPAGETVVEKGGSVVCTISPDNGWHIADVLVDGISVGAVSSYRFSNVDADHTIAAVYEKDGTQPRPTRDTVRELIAYLANGDPLRKDYDYDINHDGRINGKDLILAEMMSS